MQYKHEFLVLETAGDIAVYPPTNSRWGRRSVAMPSGSASTGPRSSFLPRSISPPPSSNGLAHSVKARATRSPSDRSGPILTCWRSPKRRRGETITLEEFRDERLRRAGGAGCEEDRRLES